MKENMDNIGISSVDYKNKPVVSIIEWFILVGVVILSAAISFVFGYVFDYDYEIFMIFLIFLTPFLIFFNFITAPMVATKNVIPSWVKVIYLLELIMLIVGGIHNDMIGWNAIIFAYFAIPYFLIKFVFERFIKREKRTSFYILWSIIFFVVFIVSIFIIPGLGETNFAEIIGSQIILPVFLWLGSGGFGS